MTELRLFLCGDAMLGRGIDQIMQSPSQPRLYEEYVHSALTYVRLAEAKHGPIPRRVAPEYVWGDALPIMTADEIAARIINLETAVTTSEEHWPKGINYRLHPGNIACLTAARIGCCVLANNHVLDWGRAGLLETLTTLQRISVAVAGAGRNVAEAAAPAVLHIGDGVRVLVFGFATTSSGVPRDWAVGPAAPGVNLLSDLSATTGVSIAEMGRRLREPGDVLIASIHWGGNWGFRVPTEHRRFAHALIESGFDLVHGHSSHHAMGIEVYRDKLILYGCGDFINDYEGIEGYKEFRGDLTAMYLPRLDVASGRLLSLRIIPMQIRCFRLNRPSPEDAGWLYGVLARESAKLGASVELREDRSFELK
jgi:poly-gamma-glutamate capsule biosynthesis protein CapA/YwtB (metallophosphatase superfamily)